MKKYLRVILAVLLVLTGYRTTAKISAVYFDRAEYPQHWINQQDTITETGDTIISPFGEYGYNLSLEKLPTTKVPSGNPTSSVALRKFFPNVLNNIVTYKPHQHKQYNVKAPFYCLLPCEYYIFALHRIII